MPLLPGIIDLLVERRAGQLVVACRKQDDGQIGGLTNEMSHLQPDRVNSGFIFVLLGVQKIGEVLGNLRLGSPWFKGGCLGNGGIVRPDCE